MFLFDFLLLFLGLFQVAVHFLFDCSYFFLFELEQLFSLFDGFSLLLPKSLYSLFQLPNFCHFVPHVSLVINDFSFVVEDPGVDRLNLVLVLLQLLLQLFDHLPLYLYYLLPLAIAAPLLPQLRLKRRQVL
jgi:hypothetical protein